MNNIDKLALETLIDRHGLSALLVALAEICGDKAEHIATNWQDATAAKAWNKVANSLLHVQLPWNT